MDANMSQIFAISAPQLARLIGTPEAPLVLDVRLAEDLASLPHVIPTSLCLPHTQCAGISDKRVVVACMAGKKLSEGVAALLRARGLAAEILEGGVQAWASAGLAMTPRASLPEQALWVTRQRPKIDRIACPWLIRRFVNPRAQFLYVAAAEVLAVAERFDAIPFDVEGCDFSHIGAQCSFDRMLDVFALHSPALDRLATVVRAADTNTHALAPQAAGLLALSVGLSRMFRDDLAQLEAGMLIYDALYRWARDGVDEGHDWPAGRNA
jgi:rhodanese-related sulfurtransferase